MNNTYAVQLQPHRQASKPLQMVAQFALRYLTQGRRVLLHVLGRVFPQVRAVSRRLGRVRRQGVEFVIAQYRQGSARLAHRADDAEHFSNLWPTVDEVAD